MEDLDKLEELANYKKKSDQGKTTFKDLGKALVTNPPLIFLLLADIAKWIFNFMCAAIAAYYFNYVALGMAPVGLGILGVLAMLGVYQMLSNLLCVIGSALSANFAKAIGSTRNAMVFALLFMAAMMFIAYFLYYDVWMVVVFMSLAQFGYGITYSCSTAMYADTVVYNEWKNRTNAAGWINGLQLFPLKIGFMARGIIIPLVLGAVGFVSAPEFAPYVAGGEMHDAFVNGTIAASEVVTRFAGFRDGISLGYMIIPAVLLIIAGCLLLVGYRLTPAKMAEYQAEIDKRRAEGTSIQK
jgi:GPH family glycoside/pentoside/hexuronide:cation symporter